MESKLNLEEYEEYEECTSKLLNKFEKLLSDFTSDEIIYIIEGKFKYVKNIK